MKTLIIGKGEVGTALYTILKDYYPTKIRDIQTIDDYEPEILHICFPYSDNFIENTKRYIHFYNPIYTVIHSTVPVGTSKECEAIHSPIRGLHPNLVKGIKTFVKFLGGERASEVADYFRRAGLKICLCDKSETTEAMKLFDTEYYRVCIEFCHRVKVFCEKNNLPFSEIYRLANITYNKGYEELGHSEFIRPVLEPIKGQIGGHCVLPNKKILENQYEK